MPLSEHEQRLLDEMERNLYQNDADFVEPVATPGRFDVAMLTVGALVAVVGLAAVLFGVIIQQPLVGILGFVIMLVGMLVAMRRGARDSEAATEPSATSGTAPGSSSSSSSFMDRLEDRWQRRLDERDQ